MSDIMLTDIRISPGSHQIGFTQLTGLKVKEVEGYLSNEFGGVIFVLTALILEDNTQIFIDGEHDFPYLSPHDPVPNMDEETLERLYAETNPYTEEDKE